MGIHEQAVLVDGLFRTRGRGRTGTGFKAHWILSPARLPIPPLERGTQFRQSRVSMQAEIIASLREKHPPCFDNGGRLQHADVKSGWKGTRIKGLGMHARTKDCVDKRCNASAQTIHHV